MPGSTRRSGYPSDSSRRRHSKQVVGLTTTPIAGDPQPSSARAGDRPCHPARTVQPLGDSDRSPRSAGIGEPAALIGPGRGPASATSPGRCHLQVTRTGAGALPTTATPPPSPARAGDRPCHPARTVLRPRSARHWQTRIRVGRLSRTAAASRLPPIGAAHGETSQPFSRWGHPPTPAGGGRRVKVTLPPAPCTR